MELNTNNVSDAARLVALGMGRRHRPSNGNEYQRLLERHKLDHDFADCVRAIARGFDLGVIDADVRAGLVLSTSDATEFKIALADVVSSSHDRPIYLLAHLLIAADAFPRSQDLDNNSYIGRVTVDRLDAQARDAIAVLNRRADEAGERTDPPANKPGLEKLWHHYHRRPSSASTKSKNESRTSTRALIGRALSHLREQGMLTFSSKEDGGTYTTNERYRLQARTLAGYELFEELATLGIAELPSPARPAAPTAEGELWHD